jgi:hypothetical protein
VPSDKILINLHSCRQITKTTSVRNNEGDKSVPVATAWRVISLRMEERPAIWRVAAYILNKQSRKADKGWSSSWGVGRGVDIPSPLKLVLLRIMNTCLGPGLIPWYELSNEKETQDRDKWWALVGAVTGGSGLRIGTVGGHLWVR